MDNDMEKAFHVCHYCSPSYWYASRNPEKLKFMLYSGTLPFDHCVAIVTSLTATLFWPEKNAQSELNIRLSYTNIWIFEKSVSKT